MSILCSICQEFLTERPPDLTATQETTVNATRCGHLFHGHCLHQWLEHQNNTNQLRRLTNLGGTCPCCKKPISEVTLIRIYPNGDEDSNNAVGMKKTVDALTATVDKLTAELNTTKEENGRLRTQNTRFRTEFENELTEHDILKLEFAQTLSKLDALQEQLNDDVRMKLALENSAKTEIDKLQQEVMAVRQAMEALQQKDGNGTDSATSGTRSTQADQLRTQVVTLVQDFMAVKKRNSLGC